jgi:hypothetical protein
VTTSFETASKRAGRNSITIAIAERDNTFVASNYRNKVAVAHRNRAVGAT